MDLLQWSGKTPLPLGSYVTQCDAMETILLTHNLSAESTVMYIWMTCTVENIRYTLKVSLKGHSVLHPPQGRKRLGMLMESVCSLVYTE